MIYNIMKIEKKVIGCIIIIIILLIVCLYTIYKRKTICNIFDNYYYFDSNGTTPIYPEALLEYNKSAYLGNVSANYADCAKDVLFNAKKTIHKWTNTCDNFQIIFNSGASEGNNYILRSLASIQPDGFKPHYILSAIEHKTSLKCAECLYNTGKIELTIINPNIFGIIDPIEVNNHIKHNTILISIIHFNNEIGSINNLEKIGAICKNHEIFFHSDVVQSFGKTPIDMKKYNLSAITLSFHKFGGPLGVGALIMTDQLSAKISGHEQISGSQFSGFRGGTENISGIAAANTAMKITFKDRALKNGKMLSYKRQLINALSKEFCVIPYETILSCIYDNMTVNSMIEYLSNLSNVPISITFLGPNSESATSPNTLLMSFIKTDYSNKRICNIKLKDMLFKKGIIISIGSVCNTKDKHASHVLDAIQTPKLLKSGVIRVSFGDHNKDYELKYLIKTLIECVKSEKILM